MRDIQSYTQSTNTSSGVWDCKQSQRGVGPIRLVRLTIPPRLAVATCASLPPAISRDGDKRQGLSPTRCISQNELTMPMPTYVNERPVKTGCWTEREDELLAEWQGKYGNRSVLHTYLQQHHFLLSTFAKVQSLNHNVASSYVSHIV